MELFRAVHSQKDESEYVSKITACLSQRTTRSCLLWLALRLSLECQPLFSLPAIRSRRPDRQRHICGQVEIVRAMVRSQGLSLTRTKTEG